MELRYLIIILVIAAIIYLITTVPINQTASNPNANTTKHYYVAVSDGVGVHESSR